MTESRPEQPQPLAAVEHLAAINALGCGLDDQLDYSAARGTVACADLLALDLEKVTHDGLRVTIDIGVGGWRTEIRGQPGGGWSITDNGLALDAFGDEELSALTDAVSGADLEALLQVCSDHLAEFVAEYEHDAERHGHHWFRTAVSFTRFLTAPGRLRAVDRLLEGPKVVLVSEPAIAIVRTQGFVVGAMEPLRGVRPPRGKPDLLAPLEDAPETDITAALRRIAFESAWAELATALVTRPGEVPIARFEGARTAEVELDVQPTADQVSDALSLWAWATAGDEIDRREAVQQAAALAILRQGDLADAARRGLPTARSIYNLARRGVVAEALAATRAARDAGAGAARAAADAAGDAASKARDRMLVQVIGGVGVAVGRATDVLSTGEARALLAVLGLVVIGLVVIALAVDLPSAQTRLSSFVADLGSYSEALDEQSITEIKSMEALHQADVDIARSRLSVLITAALVLAAVVVAITVL